MHPFSYLYERRTRVTLPLALLLSSLRSPIRTSRMFPLADGHLRTSRACSTGSTADGSVTVAEQRRSCILLWSAQWSSTHTVHYLSPPLRQYSSASSSLEKAKEGASDGVAQ